MMDVSSRLSKIHILLIDPDQELTTIIRKVLKSLGFGIIHVAKDGSSALDVMRKNTVDLVITDWDMAPMSGIEFIKKVRASDKSFNPLIPIIMLTAQARRWNVEKARDSGITEFMVKPFTAKQLCNRIIQVIDNPRHFIVSPEYIGPDRRRKIVPFDVDKDRRHFNEEENIARYKATDIHKAKEEKDVFLLDSDFTLKQKIGGFLSAKDLFSDENVKIAQQIIMSSRGDFMEWFVTDMKSLEEAFYRVEQRQEGSIRELESVTLRIKGRAGTFGYDLASQVAYSLHELLEHRDEIEDKLMMVLRKHIDALYVIIQRDIYSDGGSIGIELMDSLTMLSKKFLSNS